MVITNVEPTAKIKYKIYIEEQFAFVLYKGELSRYHIAVGKELEESVFYKIKNEIVLKRAKLRAMHLLESMDRTEVQLRTKLKQNLYTEDIIDQVIVYVRGFGYIGDLEYAKRYIIGKQKSKSKKEIYAGLCQKGVSKEEICIALEECFSNFDEKETIMELVRKRRYNAETATEIEKQKICAFLMRKGFLYEDIRQVIHVSATSA